MYSNRYSNIEDNGTKKNIILAVESENELREQHLYCLSFEVWRIREIAHFTVDFNRQDVDATPFIN